MKFYPADAVSYDDASNNRALISGKSALIFNPPSAWAVAKRDAPQVAADCWTFPAPTGPEGPVRADAELLLGRLQVQPEQVGGEGADRVPDAARAGGAALRRDRRATTCRRMPACWTSRCGKRSSRRRARSTTIRSGRGTTSSPASPRPRRRRISRCRSTTARIHNQMMARLQAGQTIPQVIAWAQDELEGFAR